MAKRARVPLSSPLTLMQKLVVPLIAAGGSYKEVGRRLGISPASAKLHAWAAAKKIPGSGLPIQCKIIVWWRGGSLALLMGDGMEPKSPSRAMIERADRDTSEKEEFTYY